MNPVTKIMEAVAEYNAYHNTRLSPTEVIERVFSNLLPPKEEPKCTCTEFQKQRMICPVCDKEEFDKIAVDNKEMLKGIMRVDKNMLKLIR